MEDLHIGDKIWHPIHGFGTVIEVLPFNDEPITPSNKATIMFDNGVRQTFALKYAPLRHLTEAELIAARAREEAIRKLQQNVKSIPRTAGKLVNRFSTLTNIARNIAHKFSVSSLHFGEMAYESKIPEVKINLFSGTIEPKYFQIERNSSLVEMCRENLVRLLGGQENAEIVVKEAELHAQFDISSTPFGVNSDRIKAVFKVTLRTTSGRIVTGSIEQDVFTVSVTPAGQHADPPKLPKDKTLIPAGRYCYRIMSIKEGEVLSEDISRFGKGLREYPYSSGMKQVLCPYWQRTDYGMIRCVFLEIESLDEDDDGAEYRAVSHYGDVNEFNKVNTPNYLYDRIKACEVNMDDTEGLD